MRFHIVSLFPDLFSPTLNCGLVGQAIHKKKIELELINPRQFADNPYHSVDDRPFGGSDSMVLSPAPLEKSISLAKSHDPKTKVIYLTPQGKVFNQNLAQQLVKESSLTLVCGRYGGLDQRTINQNIDMELSIGDYVLNGGEVAALVVVEAVARLLPGVLGNEVSSRNDSFSNGLLEGPLFTRPREVHGQKVPRILLSGDHQKVETWQKLMAVFFTFQRRPELLISEHKEFAKRYLPVLQHMNEEDLNSCGLTGSNRQDFLNFVNS